MGRAVGLGLVLVCLVAPAVHAQPLGPNPSSTFAMCLRNAPAFGDLNRLTIDNLDDTGVVIDPRHALGAAWQCSLEHADAELVPIAGPVFIGLAIIMVVWTGIRFMFGGSFDLAALLPFLLLLLFGYGLLDLYYSPTPVNTMFGQSRGLAHTVASGGITIANEIFEHGETEFLDAYAEAQERIAARGRATGGYFRQLLNQSSVYRANIIVGFAWDITSLFSGNSNSPTLNIVASRALFYIGLVMQYGYLAFLWIVYWILMAQYLWAYAVIGVLSLVGPIFIPFLLVPQLDWLFWGWIKALVNASVHMVVAACIFVVAALWLTMPLRRLASMDVPRDWDAGLPQLIDFGLTMILSFSPGLIMALASSLSVGAVAHSIMSGSAPPVAGLARRGLSALAGGATALSPFRGVGRGAGAGAAGAAAGAAGVDPRLVAGAAGAARTAAGFGPRGGGAGAPGATSQPGPPIVLPRALSPDQTRQTAQRIGQRFQQFQRGEISGKDYLHSVDQVMQSTRQAIERDLGRFRSALTQAGRGGARGEGPQPRRSGGPDHVPQPS